MKATFLPYGHQSIDDEDIAAVVDTLRSSWLTTGPTVALFEEAVCTYTGAQHGVALSSGTSALHAALHGLGVGPGDEVIVPPMTFAATANCVIYCGGTPVFADVCPNTLLIDPAAVEAAISPRTKAIIGVDYAGQPCPWLDLQAIARRHSLALVADACHSLGARMEGDPVGTLADITVFSFHPVKHITTGEGGMAVTRHAPLAERMRRFRNHGIGTTATEREAKHQWHYEMVDIGYNYRITDIQCALGISQLKKLPTWLKKRRLLAHTYDAALACSSIRPLATRAGVEHAYHIYVVRTQHRDELFHALRQRGIGAVVHYPPVHLHPYYQKNLNTRPGMCPHAEAAYAEILTLPLWPGMSSDQAMDVVEHMHVILKNLSSEPA